MNILTHTLSLFPNTPENEQSFLDFHSLQQLNLLTHRSLEKRARYKDPFFQPPAYICERTCMKIRCVCQPRFHALFAVISPIRQSLNITIRKGKTLFKVCCINLV
jgi:hypothetical protein